METKKKIILALICLVAFSAFAIYMNVKDFAEVKEEQNQLNEQKKIDTEIRKVQDPVLELTQEEVILEVGASFKYVDFIKKAEDEQGYNLRDKVVLNQKEINTDLPGEYMITFRLELDEGKVLEKQLRLVIADPEESDIVD